MHCKQHDVRDVHFLLLLLDYCDNINNENNACGEERLRQLSEKEHRASQLHWGERRVSIGRNVFEYQSLASLE